MCMYPPLMHINPKIERCDGFVGTSIGSSGRKVKFIYAPECEKHLRIIRKCFKS
jgi:hypothetical protein